MFHRLHQGILLHELEKDLQSLKRNGSPSSYGRFGGVFISVKFYAGESWWWRIWSFSSGAEGLSRMHIIAAVIRYLWWTYNSQSSRTLDRWYFLWRKNNHQSMICRWCLFYCFKRRKNGVARQPDEDSHGKTWTLHQCIETKVMVVDRVKCLPVSTALSEYKKVNVSLYVFRLYHRSRQRLVGRNTAPNHSEQISYDQTA